MTEKTDGEIDRLFNDELLPLAARLKGESVRLLDTGLEQGAASYFIRRPKTTMAKIDFESGGCMSPEGVEADLAGLWSHGDGKPLAVLAPGIARLARALREVEVESGDVSNFVYVMY